MIDSARWITADGGLPVVEGQRLYTLHDRPESPLGADRTHEQPPLKRQLLCEVEDPLRARAGEPHVIRYAVLVYRQDVIGKASFAEVKGRPGPTQELARAALRPVGPFEDRASSKRSSVGACIGVSSFGATINVHHEN